MNQGLQFIDCGLDYIYLQDGYSIVDTGYGPASVIKAPEDLHNAIAAHILGLNDLRGKEGRYLRSWLGQSEHSLALAIDLTASRVATWSRLPDEKIAAKTAAKLRSLALKKVPDRFKPLPISARGEASFSYGDGLWHRLESS